MYKPTMVISSVYNTHVSAKANTTTLPGVVVQLIVDEVPSSVIFNASYSTDAFMFTIGAVRTYRMYI